MTDRREALLLVERLKRRTRDPDVLTLCEYVHGTDVHGTIPAFRRPNDADALGRDARRLPARLTIHRCQDTRLRFFGLFCYAERSSVVRNGNWGISLELRIAKQCRGKKDNPVTR